MRSRGMRIKRVGCRPLIVSALLVLLSASCRREASIARYQVPHEEPAAAISGKPAAMSQAMPMGNSSTGEIIDQRMLGLIVTLQDTAWFFKAMGPTTDVTAMLSDFGQFRDSIVLAPNSAPTWTLPSGWQQSAGDQFRFASIDAKGVDLSVSKMPKSPDEPTNEFVLKNLNRWRDQLNLPPLTVEQLASSTRAVQVGTHDAVEVDLSGKAAAKRRPMTSSGTDTTSAVPSSPRADATATDGAAGLKFTTPEGWRPGRGGAFRLAAFNVSHEDRAAEVTVTAFGPQVGELLDNLNRWRKEVNLPPLTDASAASPESLRLGQVESQYYEFQGDAKATFVIRVPLPQQTFFIKIHGDREIVVSERERFRAFAESITWPSGS